MNKTVIGNPTTTPMAIPDWNQTDPTKADYIKNKPDISSINSLKYYGDANIVPTHASAFAYSDNGDGTCTITDFVGAMITDVVIPYELNGLTVTSLDVFSLSNKGYFIFITIPNTVKVIENNAFYECRLLERVFIPDSVTFIGENAFGGCDKVVIHCNAGSYAEAYAKRFGIAYKYNVVEPLELANNLTTEESGKMALDAYQGYLLDKGKLSYKTCYADELDDINPSDTIIYKVIGATLGQISSVFKPYLVICSYNKQVMFASGTFSVRQGQTSMSGMPATWGKWEELAVHSDVEELSDLIDNILTGDIAVSLANFATNAFLAENANTANADEDGNDIRETYATKKELPTVDQTYNPESSNAQSGKAVAEAIESVDEVYTVTADITVGKNGEYIIDEDTLSDDIATVIRLGILSDKKIILRLDEGSRELEFNIDDIASIENSIDEVHFMNITGETMYDISFYADYRSGETVYGIISYARDFVTRERLSGSIDQSYNPDSEKAQSGKAIAGVIGDIETVLDNIIAIQNTLIGGGSV